MPSRACVLRLALPFISRSVSEPQCPQGSTAISTNRVPGRTSRDNAQAHSETINKGGFVSFSLGLKSPFVEKRAIPWGLTHMKLWHKPPCLTAAGFDIFWIQEDVHLKTALGWPRQYSVKYQLRTNSHEVARKLPLEPRPLVPERDQLLVVNSLTQSHLYLPLESSPPPV